MIQKGSNIIVLQATLTPKLMRVDMAPKQIQQFTAISRRTFIGGSDTMHRSSESIAALASALAKAQTVLINPEKTMTATVHDDRREEGTERSFRYATLASGLDLVRKALGQHEIAVVQTTTAMDEPTRTVRLNTVLAHSSGEWIASDWPVCPLSDMASPKRMGAALIYARRCGLFTLVGIAGEDDLDALDLNVPGSGEAATQSPSMVDATIKPPYSGDGRVNAGPSRSPAPPPTHGPQESARLREGMLAEIRSLSADTAAAWATTMRDAKNRLTVEDARLIESAFRAQFASFSLEPIEPNPPKSTRPDRLAGQDEGMPGQSNAARDTVVAQHTGAIPKTVRRRNKEHLLFVRTQPCLVCARQPADAHHLRFAQPQALGRKVSDEFTVPLCRTHHREAHGSGKELQWWVSHKIAPLAVAENLWRQSRSGSAVCGVDSESYRLTVSL
jgi:hypothetical protein